MRFLETISYDNYGAFIPIDKIKFIYITKGNDKWEIHIKLEDGFNFIERFSIEEEMKNRYEIIKKILEENS